MKSVYHYFLYLSSFSLLLSLSGCGVTTTGQYIKTDDQGQVSRLQRTINAQGVSYKVSAELKAALVLDPTANDILALPKNSFIFISSTDGTLSFKLERQQQQTTRLLTINGQSIADSEQSRVQQQQLTLMLFRNTPIDAKGRVHTLLAHQGSARVLDEIALIADNETKTRYITELIQQAVLSEQQQLQLIQHTATIQSDYELTELLLLLAKTQPKQSDVQNAILEASSRISSDYEKRRLMTELATAGNSFHLSHLLRASQDIGSDYELGQLLQQIAPQTTDDDTLNAILTAAKTMESSYELQQALSRLPFERFSKAQNELVITVAAATITSDHELATTLISLLRRAKDPMALQNTVAQAVKTISSDSDKVRVLEMLFSTP